MTPPGTAGPRPPLDAVRIRKILSSRIHPRLSSFKIEKLTGDASNRIYHRIRFASGSPAPSVILMELAEPEGFKKSEEKVTRSSLPVKELPFINIQRHLRRAGVGVPEVLHYDRRAGWIFLEDLGDRTVESAIKKLSRGALRACYVRAIDELFKIQEGAGKAKNTCVAFGRAMDFRLLMWEFDHFLEFGLPYCAGGAVKPGDRRAIRGHFQTLASELADLPRVFTHRDYHSRNLMIHGHRIRVLDFQDALMGPYVYDLASLLRDSYVTLDEATVDRLLEYFRSRTDAGQRSRPGDPAFRRQFDMMSIQRNLKAAGRFVYIDRVKGNPGFLRYIPRTLRYVRRNLERYPEWAPLRRRLAPYLGGID